MRILYQLTSPMDKTVGLSKRSPAARKLLQAHAALPAARWLVEPTAKGPAAIESAHDAGPRGAGADPPGPARREARIQRHHQSASYSDPGLDALRELLTIPVIGPGAASLHLAAQLGTRISVLTPAGRGHGARRRAALRRWRSRALLASDARHRPLASWTSPSRSQARWTEAAEAARTAVEQDGADVLVLGCMSMAFLPGICRGARNDA